jgi:hypothetical protein
MIRFVPPPVTAAAAPPVEAVPFANAGTVGDMVEAAATLENSATVPLRVLQPGIGKKFPSTLSVWVTTCALTSIVLNENNVRSRIAKHFIPFLR